MPGVPIAVAAKLTCFLTDDATGEVDQFGFHLTRREDPGIIDNVIAVAETFCASLGSTGIIGGCHNTRTTLSNWETGPGFTGWHQVAVHDLSTAMASGSRLPPQCAVVASYRNTSLTAVPRGRRRNRMYLGPCPVSLIGADGKITPTNQNDVTNAMDALDTALQAQLDADPIPGPTGLAIVSPTAGEMYDAEEVGCGAAVDTHRSRRQKVPEATVFVVI